MTPLDIELYEVARQAHHKLHEHMIRLEQIVKTTTDVHELADHAFAIDQARRLFEESRKTLTKLGELVQKLCVGYYVKLDMTGPIRTDHVTGTPDIKMVVVLPSSKKDPQSYLALMKHIGIPEHLVDISPRTDDDEQSKDVIRPHWPGMMTYINELLAEGKPLPPGVNTEKMYPEYKLKMRARRGVSEK